MSFVLIIVAAAVFAWFLHARNSNRRPKKNHPVGRSSTRSKSSISKFASVELRCGDDACSPALSMRGTAILATEAPVLPLAGCNASTCDCGYQKAEDRRQDEGRRTADHGIQPLIFDGQEQRDENEDRRQVS